MAEEDDQVLDQEPEDQEPDDQALGMSDEDIMNMSPEAFAQQMAGQEQEEEPDEEETPDSSESEPAEEEEEEPEEEEAELSGSRDDIYDREPSEPEEIDVEESQEEAGIDYKTEYEKLLQPFRAAERDVKINSVDDARSLMQMGVDYTKKMQALKPHLKILKALESNQLLDEDKVNLLIELDKKNPEAIARFLKEKEIDPLDLNLEEETAYKPQSHMPSDQEMALDEVLDSIRGTDAFQRTVDELGNKWDAASKQVFMEQPHLIRVINDHVAAGVYDQIMNAVQTERMLGRLQGLHDLAAYKQIGDAMQANGQFDHLKPAPSSRPKPVQDPQKKEQRNARRRAAAPTRGTAKKPDPDFNPLSMSDDDFEKVQIPGMAH